ncbi:2-oxoacid:ferredoxin oxidoreductase subunit beta [Aromatoleum toluolicum]|uniref:2-oxoacid:ferredoxin oxidoreductase subunit beta n=1 Tax=Aromatoleum toluolicum TaxID=90060 RepID=A0ABX1NBN6_9RHOO|nr:MULTISPECIES: 2-oxoacid:ferredoxin oxidoreductase subunit beta [Rhodocyclales]AKU14367.1 putative 2-oxoglutarate:ferredoxin oxidoreductase beta subunit [Azoarcus sp. CIB]AYH45967.1 2-oxoacid:ferredoxin oxidoreductase subunit beta [Azoarcus sp. DN11]NMF96638.1 2-oxoacid:ferredoxin oxidoreductase subunit beta [Aromatoleum toluolicum]CCH23018.1 putative 2-oxoglutarate:ferredoxin oxidoreductase beta subunit [Azoarcus sp. CIB]
MNDLSVPVALTKKDFESNQDVRWCPGCGDYSILAQVQKLLPTLGIPRENFAFISGIGCSSRFPYYMETYGIHSIHGRAPAIASGLKLTRPELSVWVVTGDGDALAIGGNHFIHAMRRNVDLKVILLNNRIYGLTKGQYSPTSEFGKRTKSTPLGSIDRPFSPVSLALGAGATFVARTVDSDQPHLASVLARAAVHKGTAFVEVLQNCIVFNDGAHNALTEKATRDDARLMLEHGKPLVFGKNRDQGIRLAGMAPEVIKLGDGAVSEAELVVHDEHAMHSGLAFFLSQFESPELPVPLGVFRAVRQPTCDELNAHLHEATREAKGRGRLADLLHGGDTWTIV